MKIIRTASGAATLALLATLTPTLHAQNVGQLNFSIDWHGPTIGVPDSFSGIPITHGDILTPVSITPTFGPLPFPAIWTSGGVGPPALGLGIPTHGMCIGVPPCTPCPIEVDAFSLGLDRRLTGADPAGSVWFSVDDYAWGIPGVSFPPDVTTEGPAGGPGEAAADMFLDIGLPMGPIPPMPVGPIIGHTACIDGDGLPLTTPFTAPGLGVIEPNPPTFISCDPGDNVDAANAFPPGPAPSFPAFFSLDSAFPDPLGFPNTASAVANLFVGGDVLATFAPGGPPIVFAPAFALGLDLIGGPDSDDLDALLLAENGTGLWEPSTVPYDWTLGTTDMLLFSVRRGSAVIGAPDSIFGAPIEEGDILTAPVAGGVSPFPGIFIPAEALGLASLRAGLPGPLTGRGDELDALAAPFVPFFDCNFNGIEDPIDIVSGVSTDINFNTVPDDCELIATYYCFGNACPCGNNDPNAGCVTTIGVGAGLIGSGTSSVFKDDMVLVASPVPNQPGLFYMGPNQINLPFGDGQRCVGGGATGLFRYPVQFASGGTLTLGPGTVLYSCTSFPPTGCIVPFSTWNFQAWFRDPFGPCGTGHNLSNAVSVTFTL